MKNSYYVYIDGRNKSKTSDFIKFFNKYGKVTHMCSDSILDKDNNKVGEVIGFLIKASSRKFNKLTKTANLTYVKKENAWFL